MDVDREEIHQIGSLFIAFYETTKEHTKTQTVDLPQVN